MTEDERRRIAEEAKADARLESRLESVEKAIARIWIGFGAAAALILTSIWEGLKGVIFR
jgi:hypothetical protein